MAQVFKWRIERAPTASIKFRTVEVQFGDGYKQVSTDGINNKDESYAVSMNATESVAKDIMNFFNEHAGSKSFLWKPPLGELGLYLCADPTPVQKSTNLYVITGTFVRTYSSITS